MAIKLSEKAMKRKIEYDMKYNRENVTMKHVMFNKNVEEDVILLEWLKSKAPVSPYIKGLLRADMEKAKKKDV